MEDQDKKDSKSIILPVILAFMCVVYAAVVITLAIEVFEFDTEKKAVILEFEISTSWDDKKINHSMKLKLSADKGDLRLEVKGHFFNDTLIPEGEPGKPFPQLWDYEVVEAFFLNDHNEYLEIELCPHGQHLLLILRGERNMVQDMLNITYEATIRGDNWNGVATIPASYFPRDVTKFNAYSIHGFGTERQYSSLYPVPSGSFADPDFHRLEYFQPIAFDKLLPENYASKYYSDLWEEAERTHPMYEIQTTWNSHRVNHAPMRFVFNADDNNNDLKIHVEGPFFNDTPPNGKPGMPFDKLWNFEVAEVFFSNETMDYLEIELSPHGQHLLLLLSGIRNPFQKMLNITYTSHIRNDRWRGDALIPGGYFPRNVTKFNAYAIHGSDDDREYEALFPVPYEESVNKSADFHRLQYFKGIDMKQILPNNNNDLYQSSYWL